VNSLLISKAKEKLTERMIKLNLPKILKDNSFIILLILFALFLRFLFLSDTPNLIDESYRLFWGETEEGLREKQLVDFHPPLIYKFTNSLFHFFADSVLATRLVFLLFGMIDIFLIYALAKKFNSERIAAFLASVNLFLIIFSIHISPYIILSTLTLLSILILMKISEKNNLLNLVLIGIIWGVGINLHYYFALLIATQTIIIFYLLKRGKKLYSMIPICIVFLLFLPIFDLFIHQLQYAHHSTYFETSFLKTIWTMSLFYLPHSFSVSFILSNKIAMFVSVVLYVIYTALFINFLFRFRFENNKNILILSFSFFGFVFLNVLGSFVQLTRFNTRYLFIVFPLYLIMVSIGLQKIKSQILKNIILALILVFSLIGIWLAFSVFPFKGEVLL